MGKILSNHRIRSFIPKSEEVPATPSRRKPPQVPVLREETLGVKFSDYLGLPPEVHNHVTGMLPELLRRMYVPLQEAFRNGIEQHLESIVTATIPDVVRWLGCSLVGMLLTQVRGFLGTNIGCDAQHKVGDSCDGRLVFQRDQETRLKTKLGDVTYSRAYYHGDCGQSAWPLDKLLGIDGRRMLPELVEEMGLLSSQMPYEHAQATIVRWTGMAMSKHTVQMVTQNLAAETLCQQEAERTAAFETSFKLPTASAPPGKVGFVSVDGGFCKLVGQAEEAEFKLSAIGSFNPTDSRRQVAVTKPDGTQRSLPPAPEVLGKRYIGRIVEAETFTQQCTVEFHKAGLANVETVLAVTDGAEWIVNRLPSLALEHQEFFHLLDWWHTEERLGVLAKAIFEPDTCAQTRWLERMATYLWEDKLPQFFAALTKQTDVATKRNLPELVENLQGQYQYFHRRRHMLRYKDALERGFIIGSGIMEGGIRFAGKDRLCRTGMKWSHWGAEEILTLRCTWASGFWPRFINERKVSRLDEYRRRRQLWSAPTPRRAAA